MELRAKSLRSRSSTNTQVFDARVSAFPAAAAAASAGISLRRRRAFVGDRIPAGAPIHAKPANTVNLQWQRPVPGRQMHRRLPVRQHQWRVRVLPRRPIRSGPEGAVRAVRRGAILRLLRREACRRLLSSVKLLLFLLLELVSFRYPVRSPVAHSGLLPILDGRID